MSKVTDPHPRIVDLATDLLANVTTIGNAATIEILRRVEFYATTDLVAREELSASVIAQFRYIFGAIVGAPLDSSFAERIGTERAAAGVPLPAVLAAYGVGIRALWDRTVQVAKASGEIPADSILDLGSLVFVAHETYTQAMTRGYQAQMTADILGREQERSAFVEALLTGRITGTERLWDSADVLRLPATGSYVVVAAEVPDFGKLSLPKIETRLDARGVRSAWRLLPDLQVGIVFLNQPTDQRVAVEVLERIATTRVGMSPPFDDLAGTADALRLARLAVRAKPGQRTLVTAFDETPLAFAAVSAPDVMRHLEKHVLGTLTSLPREELKILVDTFAAWLDANGSTNDTATKMFCHPNTIRHRLRRIEEHTGRSLTAPRDIAEICLAFEVDRWLP